MVASTSRPTHVPDELVRNFSFEFSGPPDEMFSRIDALRDGHRVLWADAPLHRGDGEAFGMWLLTSAEDIRHVLQQPELFSSETRANAHQPKMIPIFLDPPDHARYRRLLTPLFAPKVIETMEAGIQGRVDDLVDAIAPRGACEFVSDVAVQFPTRVFASWMGLAEDQTGRFVDLVNALIHGTPEESQAAMMDAAGVLGDLIAARVAEPTDDLMSQIIGVELDGEPLSHDELFRTAYLLFLAGLDTVAAALSLSFWHLAQSPSDRAALVSGEVTTEDAAEELLRRHSFVNLTRQLTTDVEIGGVQLRKGDMVLTSLPLASRDPLEYDEATEVHLDRADNRHYAFGAGPHRCLGSHLARLEMRIFLDTWHRAIPNYTLGGGTEAYGGTVMGVRRLPLRWNPVG
jgi:cytochrome P450